MSGEGPEARREPRRRQEGLAGGDIGLGLVTEPSQPSDLAHIGNPFTSRAEKVSAGLRWPPGPVYFQPWPSCFVRPGDAEARHVACARPGAWVAAGCSLCLGASPGDLAGADLFPAGLLPEYRPH